MRHTDAFCKTAAFSIIFILLFAEFGFAVEIENYGDPTPQLTCTTDSDCGSGYSCNILHECAATTSPAPADVPADIQQILSTDQMQQFVTQAENLKNIACSAPWSGYMCTRLDMKNGLFVCPQDGYTPVSDSACGPVPNACCVPRTERRDKFDSGEYTKCNWPYGNYNCVDTSQCGDVSYPGLCPGGANIQCCIPKNNFREVGYIYDDVGVVDEETKARINSVLRKLEDEESVAVVFHIVENVTNPEEYKYKAYEEDRMSESSFRVLFVFDRGTYMMHAVGNCDYFTAQIWNIMMGQGQVKEYLDTGMYQGAFDTAADQIYNYVRENPDKKGCADTTLLQPARKVLTAGLTGKTWMERLSNSCRKLPDLLGAAAKNTRNDVDSKTAAQDLCTKMFRKAVITKFVQEKNKISAALAQSSAVNQYVATTTPCSADNYQKGGCTKFADGSYDLRICTADEQEFDDGFTIHTTLSNYRWADDSNIAEKTGLAHLIGVFDRSKKYPDYRSCRDDCLIYYGSSCASQNQNDIPVEYGTDNPLGILEGFHDSTVLGRDITGLDKLISCYSTTDFTLEDIKTTNHYCPNLNSITDYAYVNHLFITNGLVKTMEDAEKTWNSGDVDSNSLCLAAVRASTAMESGSIAGTSDAIENRDMINAYQTVYENCAGVQPAIATDAAAKANELSKGTFMGGMWTAVKSFGEPVNLGILGGTIVLTVVAPPLGVGLFGQSAATIATTARIVKGAHVGMAAYFAVPMAMNAPAAFRACQQAGINSDRCGEFVAQSLMIIALVKSTYSSLKEPLPDITAARVESDIPKLKEAMTKERTALEKRKAALQEELSRGCALTGLATGFAASCVVDQNELDMIEQKIKELRDTEGLLDSDRTALGMMIDALREMRDMGVDKESIKDNLLKTLDDEIGRGNSRLIGLRPSLSSSLSSAEKSLFTEEVPRQRGIENPEKPGARMVPLAETNKIKLVEDPNLLKQLNDAGGEAAARYSSIKDIFTSDNAEYAAYRNTILDAIRKQHPELAAGSEITFHPKFIGQGWFRSVFLMEFEFIDSYGATVKGGMVVKKGQMSAADIRSQQILSDKGLEPGFLRDPFTLNGETVTVERPVYGLTVAEAIDGMMGIETAALERIKTQFPDLEIPTDTSTIKLSSIDLNDPNMDVVGLNNLVRGEILRAIGEADGLWWNKLVTLSGEAEECFGIFDGHTKNVMIESVDGKMKAVYVDPLNPQIPDIEAQTVTFDGNKIYKTRQTFSEFVEEQMGFNNPEQPVMVYEGEAGFIGGQITIDGNMKYFMEGMTRNDNLGNSVQTVKKMEGLREFLKERINSFEAERDAVNNDRITKQVNTYNRYIAELNQFLTEKYGTGAESTAP